MRAKTSLGSALALVPALAFGQEISPKAHKEFFESKIRPVLVAHCYSCHSKEIAKPKGDLRLDQLSADFADGESRQVWLEVLKRAKAGEMPPKEKPRPSEKEIPSV